MKTAARKTLKLTAVLLVIIFIYLHLAACNPAKPEETTSPETTTAPEAPKIDFSSSDLAYKVVRPDKSSDLLIAAFTQLMRDLRENWSSSLTADTDWLAPGKDPYEYEILIGNTSRPETAEALSEISHTDYTIRIVGNKLVIAGRNEDATIEAVKYFTENILPQGPVLSTDILYTSGLEYPIESIEINGKPLGDYSVIYSGGSAYSSAADSLISWIEK
ncbi:MAG: hypothetical protein J6V48_00560, partial [Clostridia bacterium]|nr:hypothetical protein [Clostridia bacterium]